MDLPRNPTAENKGLRRLLGMKWLVLISSMWLQGFAGVGYAYGSYSPLIKAKLQLNQRQMNTLGVFKDVGDSVGLLAGFLSNYWPPAALIFTGGVQNLVGYSIIWLMLISVIPNLPFYLVCIIMLVATNGESYFNTAALVSCVRTFPQNRGPIVGILKGYTGLSGAILTIIYTAVFAPNQSYFVFLVALMPSLVAFMVMFIIRPIERVKCRKDVEDKSFTFLYGVLLALAPYMMAVLLLQDFVDMTRAISIAFGMGFVIFQMVPLIIPLKLALAKEEDIVKKTECSVEEGLKTPLLNPAQTPTGSNVAEDPESSQTPALSRPSSLIPPLSRPASLVPDLARMTESFYFSEVEDEKLTGIMPEEIRKARVAELEAKLYLAVAEGAVKVKRKKGPRRGEEFTVGEALVKADFWLLFGALWCGAGSGLTVIDNLGQMAQAQGYANAHIFVSLFSIWNFLGRLVGGYASETVARDYVYPRGVTVAASCIITAIGHIMFAIAFPGSLYIGTLFSGLGYGSFWSIVPATASELFGLKSFGALYNILCVANPAGSLIFSGVIAGTIYDREAERQKGQQSHLLYKGLNPTNAVLTSDGLQCSGPSCFRSTYIIMAGLCIVAAMLSLVLTYRTKRVYVALYGNKDQTSSQRSSPNGAGTQAKHAGLLH